MRNLTKRLSSLLLCAALLVSLCPTALAEEDTVEETGPETESVEYLDENGDVQTYPSAIPVTDNLTEWKNNWYVAQDAMGIKDRVTVEGDVYLILANGCKLDATCGIDVSQGNSLTIYAQSTDENIMGVLYATSSGGDAGIGGGYSNSGGTITINGGKVTATSDYGAGIGGGSNGEGGKITINGGEVTATSGDGAGIGGGFGKTGGTINISGGKVTASSNYGGAGIGGGNNGEGGTINITGGTVEATSESDGAGIGGGLGKTGGTINISGGKVTATSKSNGAGIGGGGSGEGGNITITDGTVEATSSSGAGIGGGLRGDGGNITISGGTVKATSEYDGAGIGGGDGGAGGNITITGGTVKATSESYGAGIGGGDEGDGGEITINGGEVTATSESGGAGIGGGFDGEGDEITITGGTVTASGSSGAGIGGGVMGNGGNITITGGKVTATSKMTGAGIGGGMDGDSGKITISGGEVTATSMASGAGIGGGASIRGGNLGAGGEITISGGTVEASSHIGAGIGGGGDGDSGTIIISGGTVEASSDYGAGIGGGDGTFSTGTGGNAFIVASSIEDQDSKDQWRGVIFVGDSGNVYGSEITLTTDAEIPANKTLDIEADQTLIIGEGVKLTNSGVIDNRGTIENRGTIDGYGMIMGNDIVVPAKHVAAEDWEYDVSSHWHPCAVPDCPQNDQFDKGVHNFGTWIVDTSAGRRYRTCGTCGYKQTEPIPPAHSHSFGTAWKTDAARHWHECSCGARSGYDVHTPGDWIIDQEATSSAEGSRHKECKICGYIMETETIPKLPPEHSHSFGPEWKTDADGHWRECACGEKAEQAAHSFGPEWKTDAAGHWQECLCGEKAGQAAHTPGEWIVDTQPTSSTQGQRHKECTVCGCITQTETIPATGGGSPGGGYIPPTTPTYPPTVEKPSEGGGTPTVTPSNPKPGDTVTVIPKPDEGYEVDKITVTDKNGKPVEVTVKSNGTYAFKQPNGKVTINVSYKPVETPWNNPFADVSEGNWYYEAVRFVQERGLMNGYSDGRFGPNEPLSRAQLAQILFNKEGRPAANYLMQFDDVAGEAWYAEAVRWAASQGIVGGYGNGAFGPNDPITREQLAVMLWRYSGSPAATSKELHFSDESEISGFALEALRWAVENGILNGYGDGRLGPQGQAPRAQVAQMLKNFIENQEENT